MAKDTFSTISHEGFKSGFTDGGMVPRDGVGAREGEKDEQELRPFFQLRHSFYGYISIRQYRGLERLFLAYLLTANGGKFFDQVHDLLLIIQPVAKVAQHRGCVRAAAAIREPVVHPEAVLI